MTDQQKLEELIRSMKKTLKSFSKNQLINYVIKQYIQNSSLNQQLEQLKQLDNPVTTTDNKPIEVKNEDTISES